MNQCLAYPKGILCAPHLASSSCFHCRALASTSCFHCRALAQPGPESSLGQVASGVLGPSRYPLPGPVVLFWVFLDRWIAFGFCCLLACKQSLHRCPGLLAHHLQFDLSESLPVIRPSFLPFLWRFAIVMQGPAGGHGTSERSQSWSVLPQYLWMSVVVSKIPRSRHRYTQPFSATFQSCSLHDFPLQPSRPVVLLGL